MKTLKPSIMELTDNFSIETNSQDLSISHEIINDELKLKITSNYSQIPSRIKLISSNRSNLKVIADIYLNENATLEIIDENDYIIDTSFIFKSFLGSRSVLELYRFNKLQSDTNNSFVHTCNMSNGSMFKDFNFTNGSDFTNNETKINLNEENAKYVGSGVVMSNSSKCENNLEIRHLSKSAVSDCSFKAVTRGSSYVSFKGKVFVDENCSNTQSNQISKGLLIDEESKINLTPILEINNDDVVCSHGAASGKADEEVLFYLASRGISKSEAERIYIQGFLSEFIEKIEDAEMQAKGQNFINENC